MVGNSKTFGKSEAKRDFNLVPKVFSLGNEKTPGDEAEILVPDFTLTANFKMAAQERAHFTHP